MTFVAAHFLPALKGQVSALTHQMNDPHIHEAIEAAGLTADLRTSSLDFNPHIHRQDPASWSEGPTYRLDLVAASRQK